MAELITQEYFNEQMATLGLKSTFAPSAEALDTLIVEASDWVENYCDRKFALENATAYLHGPVRVNRRLILPDYPVNSVASVAYEEADGTAGIEDPTLMRVLAGGIVEWKNAWRGSFDPDRYYTVNYSRGFAAIPSNVQRAVALKVADLVQPQYQGPQEREIFMVTNIQGMIVDLLEPFRRERLG